MCVQPIASGATPELVVLDAIRNQTANHGEQTVNSTPTEPWPLQLPVCSDSSVEFPP